MSTSPKQPCAPPLNLVANGTPGSLFPPPLDASDIPIMDQNPGFGDLVQSLLGDAASDADGFDTIVAEASTVIGEWDQATAAQDADLDAILAQLAAADATPADNALTDYGNTFTAGNQWVSDSAALAPPDVLEFPLNATAGLHGIVVPHLTTTDLGTVARGAAPITAWTGRGQTFPDRPPSGVDYPQLVQPVSGNWQITESDHETNAGITTFTYALIFTPDTVGSFTQQANIISLGSNSVTIYTFTVKVV